MESEELIAGLLDKIVDRVSEDRMVGLFLTGSHARGDATPYSDIDVTKVIVDTGSKALPENVIWYDDSKLISLGFATERNLFEQMSVPLTAIWVVPAIRDSKIVVDKFGVLHRLRDSAVNFSWEPLEFEAKRLVGAKLAGFAEELHKLLGALDGGPTSSIEYGTLGMLLGMSEVVALHTGLLIKSENTYFDQLRELIGKDSEWAASHRLAYSGANLEQRVRACVTLYAETARLISGSLQKDDRATVERALSMIETVG